MRVWCGVVGVAWALPGDYSPEAYIQSLPQATYISTPLSPIGVKRGQAGCVEDGLGGRLGKTLGFSENAYRELAHFLEKLASLIPAGLLQTDTRGLFPRKEIEYDEEAFLNLPPALSSMIDFISYRYEEHRVKDRQDQDLPDLDPFKHLLKKKMPILAGLRALQDFATDSPWAPAIKSLIKAALEAKPATRITRYHPFIKQFQMVLNEIDVDIDLGDQTWPNHEMPDSLALAMPDVLVHFMTSKAMQMLLDFLLLKHDYKLLPSLTYRTSDWNLGGTLGRSIDSSIRNDWNYDTQVCAVITTMTGGLGCSNMDAVHHYSCPDPALYPTESFIDPKLCTLLERYPDGQNPLDIAMSPLVDIKPGPHDVITYDDLKKDGAQIFYMWRAIQQMYAYFDLSRCKNDHPVIRDNIVPGWKLRAQFWVNQEGNTYTIHNDTIPGDPISVLLEGEDCNFMVVIRGTSNDQEWAGNFDALQTPWLVDRHAERRDLITHRGFTVLQEASWSQFNDWMMKHALRRCEKLTFTIAGHSLGGALALLWGIRIADRYEEVLAKPVEGVALAPAHPFGKAAFQFAKDLNVGLRSIAYEWDFVPNLPNANELGTVMCDQRLSIGIGGKGRVPPYSDHILGFNFTRELLRETSPHTAALWEARNLLGINVTLAIPPSIDMKVHLPGNIDLPSGHVCSYSCFFSSHYCTTDPVLQNSCEIDSGQPPCQAGQSPDTNWPNSGCFDFVAQKRC